MRKLALAVLVVLAAFGAALLALDWLWPRETGKQPALAAVPPLPPATRTSRMVTPVAVALPAIRDALEAAAPRDLSGKRDNPLGELLKNAELGWSVARGPLALAGRPEGLIVTAPLNGSFRATGQLATQAGNVGGAIAGLLGSDIGRSVQGLTGRVLDQRADIRGQVVMQARPAILPQWRIEPNLAGQVSLAEANLAVAGIRLNVGKDVKPLLDRAVHEQMSMLQARVRNDPVLEATARREWAKMCRSFPLGAAGSGLPDLWLEMRPTRAFASQPRIDAQAVTLVLGVEAETRVGPAETRPQCPFPAALELVPPAGDGRLDIEVPIDVPFSEVNRLIELQLKGRTFPEDGSGSIAVTVVRATLAPSGDRLLLSLRVNVREKASWFGFGSEATLHVWGRPELDDAGQILRLVDMALDVESEAAFGLMGAAARAALPYLQDALAERATVDLKPFAEDARKSIAAALAGFRENAAGVRVDAAIDDLRLVAIAYDAKILRLITTVTGSARVAVTALPR
ncbi:MAG: DUF4403 family protein [Xanthobacteraceae bacterium]|nr:DUF4403 family protein [Xanthobacteraceae bacterium]